MSKSHDAIAFIQRILQLAANEVGGTAKLGEHLDLTAAELGSYLRGEAIPPLQTLLRAVELVIEQVNLAEPPWQAVLRAYESGDHP